MGRPDRARHSAADYVDTVATQLPRRVRGERRGRQRVGPVSGGRPDLGRRPGDLAEGALRRAKANPATADLPVLAPALAFKWNYADRRRHVAVRRLRQRRTCTPAATSRPTRSARSPPRSAARIPTKPLVTTEAGYHNALNTTNGHLPGARGRRAASTRPRLLLEHFLRGEERVYSYELIDEFDDPGTTNPEAHFGLLRRDLSPKPAYTAMKTLLGLLSDPGPAFTPAPLPVEVDRLPERRAATSLTQKRNGQYVLLLWRDVAVYDPVTQAAAARSPRRT